MKDRQIMLPKNTVFRRLEIVEIYEFYNMPILFACRNKAGHIYLAVWIDEQLDRDIWLYVSLSPQRFRGVRNGDIDLHNAFALPEDEIVLEVIVYKRADTTSVIKSIPAENVDDNWFPTSGDFLDIPDSLPRVLWENVDQRQRGSESQLISPAVRF